MSKNCPICKGSSKKITKNMYDDRYGYKGLFDIYECTRCKHKFVDANLPDKEFEVLYNNYYPKVKRYQYKPYKEESNLKLWLNGEKAFAFRRVPKKVRVLDIGCGFGETLGYHKARGCDVYGVEAKKSLQLIAKRYGFNVHIGMFDSSVYSKEFFDYITMDQVMEHMSEPTVCLQGIKDILKEDGTVIITVPNVNGWGKTFFKEKWVSWHLPYHLHWYSPKSMKILARNAGLRLEKVEKITLALWGYFQLMHLISYPRPGEKSKYWVPTIYKDIWFKILKVVIEFLYKLKVIHVIIRFLDYIGLGDSYIFILKRKKR